MTEQQADSYDSPWKEAIELYFEECLAFFFPLAHTGIDWARGYEFLDKELQQVTPKAELGRRMVDKLVKVWQRQGDEVWVLIHLEVQSQYKATFARRMYTYNYRLFDRYERQVASLAILGDDRSAWRPDHYGYELWGCKVNLEFPIVKLLDYRKQWADLEQSRNPFAALVMAHLHTQATRKKPDERYALKWNLTRRLYEQGYAKRDIQLLFRFIDWLMALPPELESKFEEMLSTYEEKQKMPYITSIERIGIEKGIQQGIQQGVQQGIQQGVQQGRLQNARKSVMQALNIRFGEIPPPLATSINQIDDPTRLELLLEKAITVESVEVFERVLEEVLHDEHNGN